MGTSFAKCVRALALRTLITMLPLALVCLYGMYAGVPPSRLVTAQIENTAEIVSAPSTIGIADSGLYGETQAQINQTLDTLQSIGVQDIRVFVPWIFIEPAQNTYLWSSIDMVIQAAKARNMGVMAEVASTPLWAAQPGTIPGAGTPIPADYASFVSAVAQRYGTAISTYEIWNEPNYVLSSHPIDPAAYAALLKAAYPAIKAVDPSATVVAGALSSVLSFDSVTMDPVTFVQQMLAAGAAGSFDALSFHPYHGSLPFSQGAGVANSPLTQLNAIYQLMTQYGLGNEKIWISEFGASTNDVSQQTQADLIKNLLDTWQTIGYAGPAFIYTAQDGVPGADGYGIYNADWTPKLAVAVIQAAIKQYSSGSGGGGGSIIGGITYFIQSLVNVLQSIGAAILGVFQNIGQAITAFFTAIFSPLRAVLPASTPVAATVTAAALKTAGVTPKSTTATTTAALTTGTTQTTPTPEKTRTTGGTETTAATGTPGTTGTTGTTATTPAATTPAGTPARSGTTASGPTTSTPAPTSASPTATWVGGSTPTGGSKTTGSPVGSATNTAATTGASETSSASGTNKATHPSATTGVQGDSPSKSDKPRDTKSDMTSANATRRPHDGHSKSGA